MFEEKSASSQHVVLQISCNSENRAVGLEFVNNEYHKYLYNCPTNCFQTYLSLFQSSVALTENILT